VLLLSNPLRRYIRQGTLRVRDADGKVHVFGERVPGPDVAISLHDRKLYIKLFINPELYAVALLALVGICDTPQGRIANPEFRL
jgi:cyclopropane-fatty-acyl-phospholipid synthase